MSLTKQIESLNQSNRKLELRLSFLEKILGPNKKSREAYEEEVEKSSGYKLTVEWF